MKRWDSARARETDRVDKTHDNSLPSDALWTIQPGTTILLSQLFFGGKLFLKADNNSIILRKNYDKLTDFLLDYVVAAVARMASLLR